MRTAYRAEVKRLRKAKEDKKRKKQCDEDITSSEVPADPPTVMQGPMTRAQKRQLNLEASSFLSDTFHTFDNRLLPNDVILLGTLERVKRD